MIFNNLQTFNNTLTLIINGFNKILPVENNYITINSRKGVTNRSEL
jgi:hypothetical protein